MKLPNEFKYKAENQSLSFSLAPAFFFLIEYFFSRLFLDITIETLTHMKVITYTSLLLYLDKSSPVILVFAPKLQETKCKYLSIFRGLFLSTIVS